MQKKNEWELWAWKLGRVQNAKCQFRIMRQKFKHELPENTKIKNLTKLQAWASSMKAW